MDLERPVWTDDVVLRLLCSWIVRQLPAAELPYVANELVERGAAYLPAVQDWEPLEYDEHRQQWFIQRPDDREFLSLAAKANVQS